MSGIPEMEDGLKEDDRLKNEKLQEEGCDDFYGSDQEGCDADSGRGDADSDGSDADTGSNQGSASQVPQVMMNLMHETTNMQNLHEAGNWMHQYQC